MTERFFIDLNGNWLGSFENCEPDGGVEVSTAPSHASQKWMNGNWIEPSLDEIRANMPALTSRQFWMAAANIDIDKDVIVSSIKAAMPDSIDRKMMIAELEASTFERANPTVAEVMALLEISAEQVDALWSWATGL